MNFTNKDIMDLRAKTGVGMMDCKKALIEADGDMDKAVDILREKGMATSAKRAGKIASQGIVDAYGKDGVYALVEVNCESDFVAKGDQFKAFVREIAQYIVDAAPASVEDVAAAKADLLNETVAKIGEKIVVRRFERYVAADGAAVSSYIHMGGKIGVMVETVGASDEVAISRIVANAHFLSDVLVGGYLTYLIFVALRRAFFGRGRFNFAIAEAKEVKKL